MTTATATKHWTDQAACKGFEDVMFPAAADDEQQTRPGKTMCARCPVRETCLDEAMRIEDGTSRSTRHGLAGGLGPAERWKRDRVRVDPPPAPKRGGRTRAECGTRHARLRHRRYGETCHICNPAPTQEGS